MINLKKLTILMAILAAFTLVAGTAFAVPIPNGNFESGNTGFTSAYTYYSVPATPDSGYGPPPGLYDERTYGVGTDPSDYHISWSSFGDHTSGSGNMMIVNGSTTVGNQVWGVPTSGSITVLANTQYYFAAWLASVYPEVGNSPIAPATLAFSINGSQIGGDFQLSAPVGTWELFYVGWNSGAATGAQLSLINKNEIASGNDFALDDISLDTNIPAVPEPATMMLLGLGLTGLAGVRRKFRASKEK